MRTQKITCQNCGGMLFEESINIALADIGEDAEELLEQGRVSLFCPGYDDQAGCQGRQAGKENEMAYWYIQ